MELSEFLLARIAEDERRVQQLIQVMGSTTQATDRLLAECQAKRQLLDWHRQYNLDESDHPHGREDQCPAWRLLAMPYDDHPAYDEAWRPR
jgi:hypothetical protein